MELVSSQKLPPEVIPQIKRYLNDIIFVYKEWPVEDMLYLFEPYISSEIHSIYRSHYNKLFWMYLENELKAIKIVFWKVTADELEIAAGGKKKVFAVARVYKGDNKPFRLFSAELRKAELRLFEVIKSKHPGIVIPRPDRYIAIKILNIKPIEMLQKEIQALSQAEEEKVVGNLKRFICMDGEGDFTIGKHKDIIPFKSKKAGYYKVFVAIYKIAGSSSDRVSYRKISKHIKIHFGGKELKPKDIQNHINNSIKRRYLEEKTPDGKEIISSDSEGKAIYFYNPVIE